MTSAKKSALTAVVMFLPISVAVVGGMTWATVASFELAKKNVAEEHRARVDQALVRIESQIKGVLHYEAARPYTDYVDYHLVRPEAVLTTDGEELDAAAAILRSPLALARPQYDWIDLHFQVDHKGKVSSPQFYDERPGRPPSPFAAEGWYRRAMESWWWFQRAWVLMDLHENVTKALRLEDPALAGTEPEPTQLLRVPASRPGRGDLRRGSLADSQKRYVPPEDCVAPYLALRNIREDLPVAIDSGFEESSSPLSPVLISLGTFAPPFWVEGGPNRSLKLAFVRECHADEKLIYQGFIGDWERLKPELLRQIEYDFPEADLQPVPNDVTLDDDARNMKLDALPALLRVDDITGGTSAAAWRSVRGVLLISWTAALAVLITAGWGVRNLVALTERRLQFAYAVTHELRTPLTTFRLYSDMLSAGLVPDGSKQEYLDTLNRESQRLTTLVESVLEYARLENHKVRLNVTRTDAASLLRVVGETVHKRCEKNAVEGKTHSTLPDAHPVSTDVSLVSQIAAVLVDNACRHARSSTKPTVNVELGADNGRLHLDVVDSGPGVELSDSRRIFRPFRRGRDADASARGGIGLGLALARNWAALLGGRLDLVARHDSQLGGAHFRLTIPARQET